ncbi:MAG: LamG domain-containing protein [Candidatus Thermoplasmatota archaeon]|nr:LamG domain-containing protein [Candidatus Thermoplasmatota archaeon]
MVDDTRSIFSTTHAASEIIGGILLLAIAILAFSAIYSFVFPLPGTDTQVHSKLIGYVELDGTVELKHIGGKPLTSFRIDVKDVNDTLIGSTRYDRLWSIGEKITPVSTKLISASEKLHIIIYSYDTNGGEEIIFDGILQGNMPFGQSYNISSTPLLISSLLTNSTDEDLICFNKTITGLTVNSTFSATSYINNWFVNGISFARLVLPFDTNTTTIAKDYSGNNFNGSPHNVDWLSVGKESGCYHFNSHSYISIPYCFENAFIQDVTIELWVKTSNISSTLVSFNRSDYGEVTISNGHVKWATTANGNTIDLIGSTNISDDQWHHITVSYSASTGVAAIYIDGIIEESEMVHSIGSALGSGSQIVGYLGKGFDTQSTEYVNIFSDDFETDYGWTVQNSQYLSEGEWERGIPVDDERGDPPSDHDGSGSCYITGNEREEDIDGGTTWLISPSFDFTSYLEVSVECAIWYTNDFGNAPNSDHFYIQVSNNNGSSWTTVQTIGPSTPKPNQWYVYQFQIEDYATLTDEIKIRFEASDLGSGSVVEAGVDAINITGLPCGGEEKLTGLIDNLRIYERVLSEEQVYQNYLCSKDGVSDMSVIVSEETIIGDIWYCILTPNDQTIDASSVSSNTLQINLYGGV